MFSFIFKNFLFFLPFLTFFKGVILSWLLDTFKYAFGFSNLGTYWGKWLIILEWWNLGWGFKIYPLYLFIRDFVGF